MNNPLPTNPADDQKWLAAMSAKFDRLVDTVPIVKVTLAMVHDGFCNHEQALKIACVELAEQNAKLRQYVNIAELNNPTVSLNIPSVSLKTQT